MLLYGCTNILRQKESNRGPKKLIRGSKRLNIRPIVGPQRINGVGMGEHRGL